MTHASGTATVGIDIGTTAVKAIAVDADGKVLARARVPHAVIAPVPDQLEHDAARAWRRGPNSAYASVAAGLDVKAAGIAGMVPSLTAVDPRGIPRTPGLLYGDARGRPQSRGDAPGEASFPDVEWLLRWTAGQAPLAQGYWPAQAVASRALAGVGAMDTAMAVSFGRFHTWQGWDEEALASAGARPAQMPLVAQMGEAVGTLAGTDTLVAAGTVDALADQIVSGAELEGDVLVIFGATLVVWVVTTEWTEVPGYWTVPHTAPGKVLVGGPSNAGALLVDWAGSLLSKRRPRGPAGSRPGSRNGDPARVPVWLPWVRGERVPFHDPAMKASIHGLDLTQGPAAIERAALEAGGFVIRRILDKSGLPARRIVASGGGSRSDGWMQAVADASGLPVARVAVPEGAALGAAWFARMAAGLENGIEGASRWARTGSTVEPDPAWTAAASERYAAFVELGPPAP